MDRAKKVEIVIEWESGRTETLRFYDVGAAVEKRHGSPRAQNGGVVITTDYWPALHSLGGDATHAD